MNSLWLSIIIGVTLFIGFISGMFMSAYIYSEINKESFCMENWFAERVMSCYVGNQSKCLNITILKEDIGFNYSLEAKE